jgi:hypothetical protein
MSSSSVKEEGFTALFKGGPARIVRSSPQFGVVSFSQSLTPFDTKWLSLVQTLVAYECGYKYHYLVFEC